MTTGALIGGRGVHVRAPGKINLFLGVGDLRQDGYHDLASAFQAVSLFEDVHARDADGFTVTVRGRFALAGVPLDDRNLAVRAARLLAAATGYSGGVALEIRKGVPVGGGMGGGSADAAAALVACDALWETGRTTAELARLGAQLGADVPFALLGGTAIGTGRGDVLSPALGRGRFAWVLVPSHAGLSTPAVYAELDRMRTAGEARTAHGALGVDDEILHALRAGDPQRLASCLRNDLEQATLSLRPDLTDLLDLGRSNGALSGIVSGSGPTVAFLCADETEAVDLQITLSAAGYEALSAHGPVPGARIVG